MSRLAVYTLIAVVSLCGLSARAEVGVTDACQKDIGDVQEKIDDNEDDYTAESRRKAQRHLLAAKTNRLNPAKCRGNILEARKELQQGRRDKRKDD